MIEHDWAYICEEDPAIMCHTCLQCQCCSEVTEECPGEWVPTPYHEDQEIAEERTYADSEEVLRVAGSIATENEELLKRLAGM